MNPMFLADFYKIGHVDQYPKDTTQVWSNWTARGVRLNPGCGIKFDRVVSFGLNRYLKKYVIDAFNRDFFGQPLEKILAEYREVIAATLFVQNPRTDHIEALWKLQYLPLRFYALPEGSLVPIGVPSLVVTNTLPEFFWLPNFGETLMSCNLWKPSRSATIAREFRRLFLQYAREAGETDFSFVDWQGHDFSFRGMSGLEDAILSGLGHLLMFKGTDTIPAIIEAHDYYGADYSVGGSVPATEHSVMCSGSKEGELETFRRLLTEVYPSGIVSVVSDTWDLWKVLQSFIPALADVLEKRDGKLVIRPDSGDPVKIMCGDDAAVWGSPQEAGAIRLLAQAMGTTKVRSNGSLPLIGREHPLFLNTGGIIYGDAITLDRCQRILTNAVHYFKLSPYNVVMGIGSYTYEYGTRDDFGYAMKATAVRRNGELVPIFKKPVTDSGEKWSAKGILSVYELNDGNFSMEEMSTEERLNSCAFEVVFDNGRLLVDPTFEDIRARARRGL